MQSKNLSLGSLAVAILAVTVLGAATRSAAQQERVLYSFGNGTDASGPEGDLIFDTVGNLYGTSYAGGAYGEGTVFELTPRAGGMWTEKVLHSFGDGTDGANPRSGVIFGAAGRNLYGTTIDGGASGLGTVFELMPAAGGWTEQVLHSFDGTDGDVGWDKPIFDAAGNLYSTTTLGGTFGQGTVFELKPNASGAWTEKVLHYFGSGTDGAQPQGGLIFDAAGNLYAPTYWGGTGAYGTIYELTPTAGGGWTEETLFSFPNNYGADGSNPWPGVILDAAGNLYGTTPYGGGADPGGGTAFELKPTADGSWACKVLHTFGNSATDGSTPSFTRLIFDTAGNIYGMTGNGGVYGAGTLFEIKP